MKFSLLVLFLSPFWILSGYTCTAFAQYEEPAWWPLIESTSNVKDLHRCRKRTQPPAHGEKCSRKPKTCFFGEQQCKDGTPYPDTICVCRFKTWECAEIVLCPTDDVAPTQPPVPNPSTASCEKPSAVKELDSLAPVSCVPTSGSCIDSAEKLTEIFSRDLVADGDVLTICSNTSISLRSSISLIKSDLTLCCADTRENSCELHIGTSIHVLSLAGRNNVLSGITISGGIQAGGKVAIEGQGNHTIVDCHISGHASGLYVSSTASIDRLVLLRSSFRFGDGVRASASNKTVVKDCAFGSSLSGVDIDVYASRFFNTGGRASNIPAVRVSPRLFGPTTQQMPKLDVVLSEFSSNRGGVGRVVSDALHVCGNQGDNFGLLCNGFEIGPNRTCIDLEASYP